MTQSQDPRPAARTWHGTGEQAIEFLIWHRQSPGEETEFLKAWQEGNLDEWPEFYEWLDAQPALSRQEASGEVRAAVIEECALVADRFAEHAKVASDQFDEIASDIALNIRALSAQPLTDAGDVERRQATPREAEHLPGCEHPTAPFWLCECPRPMFLVRPSTAPDELRAEGDAGEVKAYSDELREIAGMLAQAEDGPLRWKQYRLVAIAEYLTSLPTLARPDSMAEMEGAIKDAIHGAYLTGATDVHRVWIDEGPQADDPDFAEAAYDYTADALTKLRAALSSGSEGGRNG